MIRQCLSASVKPDRVRLRGLYSVLLVVVLCLCGSLVWLVPAVGSDLGDEGTPDCNEVEVATDTDEVVDCTATAGSTEDATENTSDSAGNTTEDTTENAVEEVSGDSSADVDGSVSEGVVDSAGDESGSVADSSGSDDAADITQTDSDSADGAVAAALPDGIEVPTGFDQWFVAGDIDSVSGVGLAVSVYMDEGLVSTGATLNATILTENSGDDDGATGDDEISGVFAGVESALTELFATTTNASETSDVSEASDSSGDDTAGTSNSSETSDDGGNSGFGFSILDIWFEVDGNRVELSSDMFVAVNWFGLLPEDANMDSVGVYRYLVDSSVELVADASTDTEGELDIVTDSAVAADTDSSDTDSSSGPVVRSAFMAEEGMSPLVLAWEEAAEADEATDVESTGAVAGTGTTDGEDATTIDDEDATDQVTTLSGSVSVLADGDNDGDSVAQVAATKTATLQGGATDLYDLLLSVSGERGTKSNPQKIDVLLVLDKSSSMLTEDFEDSSGNISRLAALKKVAADLIDTIEANDGLDAMYNVLSFAHFNTMTQRGWTNSNDPVDEYGNITDRNTYVTNVKNHIGDMSSGSGDAYNYTNYQKAIYTAKSMVKSARDDALVFVLFVSDGLPTQSGTTVVDSYLGDDRVNYHLKNALEEIGGLECDYFYAVGVGGDFASGSTGAEAILSLVEKASSVRIDKGYAYAPNYNPLIEAFNDFESMVEYFPVTNVVLQDTLSEWAQLVTNSNGGYDFTITVTDSGGDKVDEATVTIDRNGGTECATLAVNDTNNEVTFTVTVTYDDDTGK